MISHYSKIYGLSGELPAVTDDSNDRFLEVPAPSVSRDLDGSRRSRWPATGFNLDELCWISFFIIWVRVLIWTCSGSRLVFVFSSIELGEFSVPVLSSSLACVFRMLQSVIVCVRTFLDGSSACKFCYISRWIFKGKTHTIGITFHRCVPTDTLYHLCLSLVYKLKYQYRCKALYRELCSQHLDNCKSPRVNWKNLSECVCTLNVL